MDIKERIDKLTETEAKAALYLAIKAFAWDMPCWCCDVYQDCPSRSVNRTADDCMKSVLNEVLKEARK